MSRFVCQDDYDKPTEIEAKARLHRLARSGRVAGLLAAVEAHLRRRPIELAVETVTVRG